MLVAQKIYKDSIFLVVIPKKRPFLVVIPKKRPVSKLGK
jgi:hypothetical protein